MNNVKVAILDTGIANEIVDDRIKLKKEIYYDYYDEEFVYKDIATDFNGHGTQCINTMWEFFPCIDVYVINVMGISGKTGVKTLIEALKYVMDLDVDIISFCSSLIIDEKDTRLFEICSDIKKRGKIIISAVENTKESTAIANYPGVIGVIGKYIGNYQYSFCKDRDIQMCCDSSCHLIRGCNSLAGFFQGNSRATAIATSIVAKLLYENKDKDIAIEELLEKEALLRTEDIENLDKDNNESIVCDDFDNEYEEYLVRNEELYQRLVYALCDFLECANVEDVRKKQLWLLSDFKMMSNISKLFDYLYYRLNIKISDIDYNDLKYAYKIYNVCIHKNVNS